MIALDRLAIIVKTCDAPAPTPEAEKYRGICGELLDQIAEMAASDTLHLRKLINEHGQTRNDDVVETGRATERYFKSMSNVLFVGRNR